MFCLCLVAALLTGKFSLSLTREEGSHGKRTAQEGCSYLLFLKQEKSVECTTEWHTIKLLLDEEVL